MRASVANLCGLASKYVRGSCNQGLGVLGPKTLRVCALRCEDQRLARTDRNVIGAERGRNAGADLDRVAARLSGRATGTLPSVEGS